MKQQAKMMCQRELCNYPEGQCAEVCFAGQYPADPSTPTAASAARVCCDYSCNQGRRCHAAPSVLHAVGSGAAKPLLALICERAQKNAPVTIFLVLLSVILAMAIIGFCWEALTP